MLHIKILESKGNPTRLEELVGQWQAESLAEVIEVKYSGNIEGVYNAMIIYRSKEVNKN